MNQDGSLIVNKKKKLILNNIMRNYGFDYLVEKVQVLNEMAPKSKFWNTNFPEFMNFYLDVQSEMAGHPKAPPTPKTLADRRVEYISRMLFEFLSREELAAIGINKSKGFVANVRNLAIRDLSIEEREGTRKKREYTPGYAEFAGKWADNTPKQQDYMLSLMVRAYEDKALSKKFTNKVMDYANIDAYFNKNLFKDKSSNFASGMMAKKEGLLNMGLADFYEIQNTAKGIIQRLRKSKNLPKGLLLSIYHTDRTLERQNTEIKKNEFFDLNIFKNTLEDLIEYRRDLVKNMSRMDFLSDEQNKLTDIDKSVLENMLNNVNVSIQKGDSISKDQIEKLIIPKFMGGISDIVLKNYIQNYDFESSDDEAELKADRYQTIYDTLDDDLLDHMVKQGILSTDEKDVLQKWREASSNLQQQIVSKTTKDRNKAEEAQYRQDAATLRKYEYDKKGKEWEAEKGQKQPKKSLDDLSSDPEELKTKLEELMSSDDPDFEEIDRIGKKLKKLGGLNESSVTNYMTEQVHRDGFSDNRGKFVDRGFKKPKNYAHWLWLNEQ
jgi:hypothetical protein